MDESGRLARPRIALVALSALCLVSVAIAGCGAQRLQAETLRAGSPEANQAVAASAATVAAEETRYLQAVRASGDALLRVSGLPAVDDRVLLAFGYGVCRHATQTRSAWSQIEESTSKLGGGPTSEHAQVGLVVVRAARANLCGERT